VRFGEASLRLRFKRRRSQKKFKRYPEVQSLQFPAHANAEQTAPERSLEVREPTKAPLGQHIPQYHSYSLDLITRQLLLVLNSTTSLRGAVRALAQHGAQELPDWTTGRWWLLRLGYYKLERAKETGADWVWIVDHTMQVGAEKCLLILGFRLGDWAGGSVRHEDVEPLTLEPVRKSNGEIVYQQLEKTVEKTGLPRQIVGDEGGDLKAGIALFLAAHPEIAFVHDIKHKTALMLKRELKRDATWEDFRQYVGQVGQEVRQTALAALGPPRQRSQARYMNLGPLLSWGQKLLGFLTGGPTEAKVKFDWARVREKFGVLEGYREALNGWGELLAVAETAEKHVREHGVSRMGHLVLRHQLPRELKTERGRRVWEELVEHIRQEGAKAQEGERLLGSSEVIESVFGKFKWLERTQAQSGLTGLLLALPAIVSKTTKEVVGACLNTVPTKTVVAWCRKKIGLSVQAKRRLALPNGTKMVTKGCA
jgi:hypothetical protein